MGIYLSIYNPACALEATFSHMYMYGCTYVYLGKNIHIHSEIPLLRTPKIKRHPLKTLFAKFKLLFSSFSTPSVPMIRDHLWDCPKVVLIKEFYCIHIFLYAFIYFCRMC